MLHSHQTALVQQTFAQVFAQVVPIAEQAAALFYLDKLVRLLKPLGSRHAGHGVLAQTMKAAAARDSPAANAPPP